MFLAKGWKEVWRDSSPPTKLTQTSINELAHLAETHHLNPQIVVISWRPSFRLLIEFLLRWIGKWYKWDWCLVNLGDAGVAKYLFLWVGRRILGWSGFHKYAFWCFWNEFGSKISKIYRWFIILLSMWWME